MLQEFVPWLLPISNAVVFLLNFAAPYRNLAEVTDEFPTLLRPANWSFGIWVLIYVLQAIFLLYSLLPHVRPSALIQKGVSIWFIVSVLFCIGWAIVFSRFRSMAGAVVMLACVWCSLVIANWRIYRYRLKPQLQSLPAGSTIEDPEATNVADYWCVQVPFSLYFGWITVALVININMLIYQADKEKPAAQLSTNICSLLMLVLLGAALACAIKRGDWVFNLALAWAALGVAVNLGSDGMKPSWASDLIVSSFRESIFFAMALFLVFCVFGGISTFCIFWKNRSAVIQIREENFFRQQISLRLCETSQMSVRVAS